MFAMDWTLTCLSACGLAPQCAVTGFSLELHERLLPQASEEVNVKKGMVFGRIVRELDRSFHREKVNAPFRRIYAVCSFVLT